MRNPGTWLVDHYGNRGILLLLIGIPWVLLGTGFVFVPMERFSKPGPGGPLELIDNGPFPAILWIVGGILAIHGAFTRLRKRRDGLGFFGVVIPPFIWSIFYYISYASNQITGGEIGRPNTWIAGTVYASVTVLLLFLSAKFRDDPIIPKGFNREAK